MFIKYYTIKNKHEHNRQVWKLRDTSGKRKLMNWKANLKKFSQMQHRKINDRKYYKLKDLENGVRKFNLNLNRVPEGKGRQCIEPDSKSNASLS